MSGYLIIESSLLGLASRWAVVGGRVYLFVKVHASRCKRDCFPGVRAFAEHLPSQVVFVGDEYFARLGNVPDLQSG